MKVLGLIPARGGSKGIKNKNIYEFNSKPLISYTIQSAIESDCFSKVVVSTDSDDIINIANRFSVCSIKRSEVNSSDEALISDVVIEVLSNLDEIFEIIILLQPTAPIRNKIDFINIINLFKNKDVQSVVSVVKLDDIHPARMYYKNEHNKLIPLQIKEQYLRRQDLKPVFIRNGCFYAFRSNFFNKYKSLYDENTVGYEMKMEHWLNIDDRRDVIIAKSLIDSWLKNK